METINIDEVVQAVKGKLHGAGRRKKITGVSINSREVKKGDLFVAIKGNKVDGHSFVKEAANKGAVTVMVQRKPAKMTGSYIIVDDTLRRMGDLAGYYRRQFNVPFIGITGSTGKTTSKELTALCLATKYNVLKNKSSYNSLTGVPLTLFNLSNATEVCVLEIGANQKGEIKRLSEITNPDVGVITNIGPCHLEAFKTVRGVLAEKAELLYKAKTAIVNGDDPLLGNLKSIHLRRALPKDIFKFGINGDKLDLVAKNIELDVCQTKGGSALWRKGIKFRVNDIVFSLPFIGIHNVYNALTAISIGLHFDLSLPQMADALKEARPMIHRDEIINIRGICILDSTYNANPFSMRAAIKELCDISIKSNSDVGDTSSYRKGCGRKIAVLGDMLELGKNGKKFHKEIGEFLKEQGVDIVIGVGGMAKFYIQGWLPRVAWHFNSAEEAVEFLNEFLKRGDRVLVKGSHATGLEKILKGIKNQ